MYQYDLSDEQWCLLDLLIRSKQKGIAVVNRQEILNSPSLPQVAAIRLVWAALTMPSDLVQMIGQHGFRVTDSGISLYNLRFGRKDASAIADAVICLPGPDKPLNA